MKKRLNCFCFGGLWIGIWLLQAAGPSHGLLIEFYENSHYKGFLFETTSFASPCQEMPKQYIPFWGSVKTDTCVMAYMAEKCNRTVVHQRIDPPGLPRRGDRLIDFQSYKLCTPTDGGAQLNVDIYEGRGLAGRVLASYQNVCSCQNLPRDIFGEDSCETGKTYWYRSADTHGNEVTGYADEGCTGEVFYFPAGLSSASSGLILECEFKSFRPTKGSKVFRSCLKLFSSIFKFQFTPSNEPPVKENVELAAKTVFINNGTAVLTQEYTVSKTVRETLEMEVSESFSKMHAFGVEASVETETEGGIPFLASTTVKVGLTTSYKHTSTSENSKRERTAIETTREVTRRQTIEVPPCTSYTMHGTMDVVRDRPIEYKAFAKISRLLGKQQLKSTEVREYMDAGLEYVEDFDEFTVIAIATGTMKAEYSLDARLDGHGESISGCIENGSGKSMHQRGWKIILGSYLIIIIMCYYQIL